MNSEKKKLDGFGRDQLSEAGRTRRDAMRESLNAEFELFHTRRRRNRVAFAIAPAIVLLLAAGLWWNWSAQVSTGPENPVAVRQQPVEAAIPQPELAIAEPKASRIEFELINDDQLLDMLAEAGHPSALAWIRGKPVVIPLGDQPAL